MLLLAHINVGVISPIDALELRIPNRSHSAEFGLALRAGALRKQPAEEEPAAQIYPACESVFLLALALMPVARRSILVTRYRALVVHPELAATRGTLTCVTDPHGCAPDARVASQSQHPSVAVMSNAGKAPRIVPRGRYAVCLWPRLLSQRPSCLPRCESTSRRGARGSRPR